MTIIFITRWDFTQVIASGLYGRESPDRILQSPPQTRRRRPVPRAQFWSAHTDVIKKKVLPEAVILCTSAFLLGSLSLGTSGQEITAGFGSVAFFSDWPCLSCLRLFSLTTMNKETGVRKAVCFRVRQVGLIHFVGRGGVKQRGGSPDCHLQTHSPEP